ncbi:MAG: DUF484 family protein [Pseudomonadota bacterium]
MSKTKKAGVATATLRKKIISDPALVLEDPQVLDALLAAQEKARGSNVVDMRGLAMSRLEDRLGQLEDTHQSVLTAAYENVATTRQVHRAILTMVAPLTLEAFLTAMDSEVADVLRLRAVRLVLEGAAADDLGKAADVVALMPQGFVGEWLGAGHKLPGRQVVLRQVDFGLEQIYGAASPDIRSEALMRLDLGPDRPGGLMVLGAPEAEHFVPGQATDLLELFGRIFERMLRSWLG